MRNLFAALMLSLGLLSMGLLIIGLALPAAAETHGAASKDASRTNSTFNKDIALVGGAMLGLVLASGAISIANTGIMIYEGAAIMDALEGAAGLSLPVAVLSGALGALFGQDTVLRNMPIITFGEPAASGH